MFYCILIEGGLPEIGWVILDLFFLHGLVGVSSEIDDLDDTEGYSGMIIFLQLFVWVAVGFVGLAKKVFDAS